MGDTYNSLSSNLKTGFCKVVIEAKIEMRKWGGRGREKNAKEVKQKVYKKYANNSHCLTSALALFWSGHERRDCLLKVARHVF